MKTLKTIKTSIITLNKIMLNRNNSRERNREKKQKRNKANTINIYCVEQNNLVSSAIVHDSGFED